MSNSAEIERQADASRDRLSETLDQLRENLSPDRLVDEIFDRFGGPRGSSVVQRVESVVRDHPLPMMLMGIGTAMWLSGSFRNALGGGHHYGADVSGGGAVKALSTPAPRSPNESGIESIKENVAAVGQSIADNAYQVLRTHAAAKLDEYTKLANEGINSASAQIMGAMEDQLDRTVHRISSTMQNRSLGFSIVALAVGAALGSMALRSGSRR